MMRCDAAVQATSKCCMATDGMFYHCMSCANINETLDHPRSVADQLGLPGRPAVL